MTPSQINAPDGGYVTGGYREIALPVGLHGVAEVAWSYAPSPDTGRQRVLPETGTSLFFTCLRGPAGAVEDPALALMGPIRAVRIFEPRTDLHMVGVRLRTEWCPVLLGVRPGDHVDGIETGLPSLATRFPRLRDRLVRTRTDTEALGLLLAAVTDAWAAAVPSRGARLAHAALEPMRAVPSPPPGACDAPRRLGVTERHLRRVVNEVCAGGMKTFHRVRRLHHAVSLTAAGRPPAWSRLALEAGYYDQAHMIREFGTLAGVTPVGLHQERRASGGPSEG